MAARVPADRARQAPLTAVEAAAILAEQAWRSGRAHAASGETEEALFWLRRARRLAPRDPMVAFTLAATLLGAGEPGEAAALFEGLAGGDGPPDAWAGLAAAARAMGDAARAEAVLARALSEHAATDAIRALAAEVAVAAGRPGWCSLDAAGQLLVHGRPDAILLDGRRLTPGTPLPEGWRRARQISVARGGAAFLGSPIRPNRIARLEGVVAATEAGGLEGWAWHPADPALDPELRIVTARSTWTIRAAEPAAVALPDRLFARPRRFALAAGEAEGVVRVLDGDGRDLLGSPLDPGARSRGAVALALAAAGRGAAAPPIAALPVGSVTAAPRSRPSRAKVAVVVPVYRGLARTLTCLASVLETVPEGTAVIVVDDASPEPELSAAMRSLAGDGRVRLVRRRVNEGFPAAANAGLRAAGRRDVVLLNSDTIVPPGWLERLREAAYAAPDTGSVTPLSNDATLASYPAPGSPAPDRASTVRLDRLARRANAALTVEVPTGVGFCLYMRRDCLDQVGSLRETVFAQGYGEENDWCLRGRALGWRHLVAAGVFVAHVGGQSFGSARDHLLRRNLAVLNQLHPGYDDLIASHAAADPLAPARRRLDALRWRAGRRASSAILVTHEGGGGVGRVVAQRCDALRAAGRRAIVLTPDDGWCRVGDGEGDYLNLRFRLPAELADLARLLRGDRPAHVELHHTLGHDPAVLELAARLNAPWDAFVHDYAWFCPRISLMSYGERYCGEPDVAACEACVDDLGTRLDEPIGVRDLLARSGAVLGGARRVVAPSADAAARLRRHFPAVRAAVEPWQPEAASPRPAILRGAVRHVAVVGAIGAQKGYDVLLACVRDARARDLALRFTVVGHTCDDARLLAAGPARITGPYGEAEAASLVRAQRADIAFLPSIWPETWCFALSLAWEAGLAVAAFDLGAQAERIRRTGRGWLLPLGLPAASINAALLAATAPTETALASNAMSLHFPRLESTVRA